MSIYDRLTIEHPRRVTLTVVAPWKGLVRKADARHRLMSMNDSHSNYRAKTAVKKAWQAAGQKAWENYIRENGDPGITPPVDIIAIVHRRQYREMQDAENIAPTTKAIIDGIIKAGMMEDDSDTYRRSTDHRAGRKIYTDDPRDKGKPVEAVTLDIVEAGRIEPARPHIAARLRCIMRDLQEIGTTNTELRDVLISELKEIIG